MIFVISHEIRKMINGPDSPFIVGMALKADKAKKHVRRELLECAESHGIRIVVIDENKSLEEQGPFDVILQKIRRPGA